MGLKRLFQLIPLRSFGYYLITGLIVIAPALMNNYPLVYADSNTYVASSRNLLPPIDRPIGYSLLIRAVTWQSTLWTIILFQGMVMSWLIHEVLRSLFPNSRTTWRKHVLMLTFLTLFTSLPWYASQIMPDVLSGGMGLCVFLLLLGRNRSILSTCFLWVLLFVLTTCHLSFLAMLFPLCLGLIVLAFVRPWFRFSRLAPRKTLVGLLLVPILASLFIVGYNDRNGHGAVLSPTSSLFLAGRFAESGVLRTYLSKTCASSPHELCDHLDQLRATGMYFVWDAGAPTRQHRGLVESSGRLDTVVHDILTDPSMWPMLAWTSVVSTLTQLAQVNIGSGIEPYQRNPDSYAAISRGIPHELPAYLTSRQQRGGWNFEFMNALAMPLYLAAWITIVMFFPPKSKVRWVMFILIMLATVILNAFATGAIANVYDRLQARVTWLVIFAALAILFERYAFVHQFFLSWRRVVHRTS